MSNVFKTRAQAAWIEFGDAAAPGIKRGLDALSKGFSSLFGSGDMEALERIGQRAGDMFEALGRTAPKIGRAIFNGLFGESSFEKFFGEGKSSAESFEQAIISALPQIESTAAAVREGC